MTNEEKQEIIAAVLEALSTNSKTISNLTPVTSLMDSDLFEVAGGSRITFANLVASVLASPAYTAATEEERAQIWTAIMANFAATEANETPSGTDPSKINAMQSRIVLLDSMGSTLDGSGYIPLPGDWYYQKSGGYQIHLNKESGEDNYKAAEGVLYINKRTGKTYLWSSDEEDMIELSSPIHVVNNLEAGGEEDALSAEMGKTLMVAIQQILGALGNYAFPGGKPTIDWGGSGSVSYSVTYPTDEKVTHSGAVSTVELGSSLEVTLGIASGNDLYAIKDSSVKVYMGGVEQSGAYNASTQTVTLAAVTGNVVIFAEAWTYVSRGLVMHLDGRNRGDVAGHWKSLVNYNNGEGFNDKIDFTLTNCDETHSDYVAFDGDPNGNDSGSKAIANISLLDVSALTGTIEAGYANAELNSAGGLCVMHNALGSGNRICLSSWRSSSDAAGYNKFLLSTSPADSNNNTGVLTQQSNVTGGGFYSFVLGSYKRNGSDIPGTLGQYTQTTVSGHSILSLFWRKTAADNVQYSKGRLYSLRVYSVQLDDDERARNLAIDQKRFNLA